MAEVKAEAKAEVKKVNVCRKCSGVDKEDFKGIVKVKDLRVGCIKECGVNEGKVFGYLNGELVVCDTKEQFLDRVRQVV